jgi:serine/threonine protein kinase
VLSRLSALSLHPVLSGAQNLLLASPPGTAGTELVVKITDFGLSKDKDTQSQALGGTKTMLMTGCGSVLWMAPEILHGQVSQNDELLSRRGHRLPANASVFDTHRDPITGRFDRNVRGGVLHGQVYNQKVDVFSYHRRGMPASHAAFWIG